MCILNLGDPLSWLGRLVHFLKPNWSRGVAPSISPKPSPYLTDLSPTSALFDPPLVVHPDTPTRPMGLPISWGG